jgi:hypothetical protein
VVFLRFFQELCAPQTKISTIFSSFLKPLIFIFIIKPVNYFKSNKSITHEIHSNALLLIYDLSVEPITFNFVFSLVTASYQCQIKGLQYLDVLMIKGTYHDLRQEEMAYEAVFSISARQWRVQSILIGALPLVSNFRQLFIVDKKNVANYLNQYTHQYPNYYTTIAPTTYYSKDAFVTDPRIRCLRADNQSLKMMSDWLLICAKGRQVITMTLRQSAYYPDRNSNTDHWLRLANSLDPQQYCVIFVLDTEGGAQNTHQLAGFDCSIAASMSVPLRMALYELSYLCLGVNNGPMALCWFNDRCKYITFKIITFTLSRSSAYIS